MAGTFKKYIERIWAPFKSKAPNKPKKTDVDRRRKQGQ